MKKCLSLGAALALTIVVAACGSGSSGNSTGASASSGSSKSYPELVWASVPVRRADVQNSFDFATFSLVAPVEQGLVSYDKDGTLVPALAESIDQPDTKTYVYHLKSGVQFSDGKPLTVEDVVWSLKRNLAKDANTASNWTNVASIEAQGNDTVVIKLKRADVTFANVPAFSGQIVEKAAAEAGGVDKLGTPSNVAVGTGPYRFASFNPDVGATFELNPHWRGQKPLAQKVNVKFVRDDSALALAMRSGDVDGGGVFSRRNFQFPGVHIVPVPGTTQVVISMNTIAAPFDDIHVRRAIAYATDREGLRQAIYGADAVVDEGMTPVSLFGSIAPTSQVQTMYDALPRYGYDIAAAKAEMAKSRYPNGFTTTLPASPTGDAVKVGQAMAPDLAKIGIKLKVDQITDSEYLALLYGPRNKLGLLVDHYGATYPDPSALLTYWLDPAQAIVNGLNSANYRSAQMGSLLAQQRQEPDRAKRLQLLGDALRLEKEDVPYIPLYAPSASTVVSDTYALDPNWSVWTAAFSPWPLLIRKAS